MAPRYAAATSAEDFSTAVVWGGERLDLVREVEPAARIIAGIMEQAEATRSALARI